MKSSRDSPQIQVNFLGRSESEAVSGVPVPPPFPDDHRSLRLLRAILIDRARASALVLRLKICVDLPPLSALLLTPHHAEMTPSNLQGLNLIHPESPPSNLTDTQDLLSTPIFPDFVSNDLDLWSTINFASDEPFVSAKDRQLKVGETEAADDSKSAVAPAGQESQFDFAQFLANFGINANANADASILSGVAGAPALLPQATFPTPVAAPPPAPAPTPTARSTASTPAPEALPPAAKRARTTKTSTPATATASTSSETFPAAEPNTSTPLTPAEDKRRRNTAASARFRLKKKEREAALDARAHALEERVTELERECESLRRENGWLRGLVVGVTGGVVPAMSDAPILASPAVAGAASSSGSGSGSAPAQAGASEKRKRDDEAT